LLAGQKAKASTAYEPSFRYLTTGIDLLHEQSWGKQYDLTLSLFIEATEIACLIGKFNLVEKYNDLVLENARTVLDKVKIYEVRILAYK